MGDKKYYQYLSRQLGLSDSTVIGDVGMFRKEDKDPELALTTSNVVARFIAKILSFDYRAVSIFSNLTITSSSATVRHKQNGINCLDAVLVVLNHCDDFARQKIIECMAKCNLAVPVLLPDLQGNGQGVYQHWGLASVAKTIPSPVNEDFADVLVSRHPFHVALFVQFGDIKQLSVPLVINTMMGEIQQNNIPFNFYSDSFDCPPPQLSQGLLESVWFVPNKSLQSKRASEFKTPMCVFFAHGNTNLNEKELGFAFETATVITIFISKESLKKFKEKIDSWQKKKIVVAVISPKPSKRRDTVRGNIKVKDFSGETSQRVIAKGLSEEIVKILDQATLPEFALHDVGYSFCREKRLPIDMNNSCQSAFEKAKTIQAQFHYTENSYRDTFKLLNQWEVFSKLYKDTSWKRTKENIALEIDKHQQQMKNCRIAQINEVLSYPVQLYLEAMRTSPKEQIYITSWLKLFLKYKALKQINSLEKNIRTAEYQYEQHRHDFDHSGNQFQEAQEHFRDDRESFGKLTYGIDTLVRELGQIYECQKFDKEYCAFISDIAANMVLNGHPVEILDGGTGNVPIRWLEGIFHAIQKVTQNKQVCVISILGVQSAGKSTFLNTVFGTNFEVNAGHCTRGVSFQVVKLDKELSVEIGCHYIIVVDTEGLQPMRDISNAENEMATFVLCLSNFTFLNIAGQTIDADIKNILQIAALAFVRMNEVNMKSECFVVQQLVSDQTASQKNKRDIQSLRKRIKEAEQHAVNIENLAEMYKEECKDIFKLLNLSTQFKDLQYFPPLWGGGPMSPPETRYGDLVGVLRSELLKNIFNNKNDCLYVHALAERMVDVWKAVKEDNFLFFFQNREELEQYNRFKEDYHKLCSDFAADVKKWQLNNMRKIKECKGDSVRSIESELQKELNIVLYEKNTQVCQKVKYLLQKDEYWLIQKRAEYFQDDFKERVNNSREKTTEAFKKQSKLLLSKQWDDIKQQISKKLHDSAKITNVNNSDSVQSLTVAFEQYWEEEIDDIQTTFFDQLRDVAKQQRVLNEIINNLHDRYHDSLLEKELKKQIPQFLNKDKLRAKIQGSNFIQLTRNREKIYSNYKTYFIQWHRSLHEQEQLESIRRCSEKVIAYVQSNTVSDGSIVSIVTNEMKFHQSRMGSETFAKVVLEICLQLAPLILQENIANDWAVISEHLENSRGDFYRDFLLTCKSVSASKSEFQHKTCFQSFLKEELLHEISNSLLYNLVKVFQKGPFLSKKHLLQGILSELCKHGNFDNYLMYLTNTKHYIEMWALQYISEDCVKKSHSSYNKNLIRETAEGIANEKLQKMRDILKRSQKPNITFSKLFDTFFTDIGRHLDIWYDQNKREMFKQKLSFLSASDFFEECSRIMSDMVHSIVNDLNIPKGSDVGSVQEWFARTAKTHKELISNLKLCYETCPFCPVTCDETDYHVVHRSFRHLPQGLGGVCHKHPSNELVTDACPALIATESVYATCDCDPSECQHTVSYYKNYKEEHPDWYIHPEGMSESHLLDNWKWVFNEFNREFASYYGADPAIIPAMWTTITREDAIQSIKLLT